MPGRPNPVMEHTEEKHTASMPISEALLCHLFLSPCSHHQKRRAFISCGLLQHGSFLRRNKSLLIIIGRQLQHAERHHRRQYRTHQDKAKRHQCISLKAINHNSFDPAPHRDHASIWRVQILMECQKQIITDFESAINQHATHANSSENDPAQTATK